MALKRAGFLIGILFFAFILATPTPSSFVRMAEQIIQSQHISLDPIVLASSMRCVLAVLALMVVWWLTEAIPLAATALLPAVLFPILRITGVQGSALYQMDTKNTLLNYASPVIFLFLGGFLLAGAMQKWKLDRRFTLWFLTRGKLAENPKTVLLGVMCATAFISMWISNTATAAMMLPLGLGILTLLGEQPGTSRFGTAMMLGIAWAASIGGVGTIIGTPPNGIALGILNSTFAGDPSYHRITFLDWMALGVPCVLIILPIAWFLLVKMYPPAMSRISGGKAALEGERSSLGGFSPGERGTVGVFALAVLLWVSNPFWQQVLPEGIAAHLGWLDEYSIGLTCGVLLFVIPVNIRKAEFILDWHDTKFVDWGTLILFGGGIALSDAMFKTGLANWMASSFVGLFGAPSVLVLLVVIVIFMELLTEVTSNTAVTTMMVPVIISIALRAGDNPTLLAVAAALGASMAFMLPVATPPNALVYGTGYVKLRDMVRTGFLLDLLSWVAIAVILLTMVNLFGVMSF